MKTFRSLSVVLLFAVVFSVMSPFASALDEPILHAQAVVLADMDSGNILFEKNMNQRRSPASLTKIMTGLLAVEALERGEVSLDDIITAPSDCWTGMDLDSSNAEIAPGEKMTFQDYLYCALVKSANEACNVIAVAICGNIQNFVNRMNLRANELGATHTFFSDTNGLSNTGHYTTAYDLFLITREAMKHDVFVDAVNTLSYEIEPTNTHKASRSLKNSNALLCNDGPYGDGYLYIGASGVKTGYTRAAGYCLVSTAEKKDTRLIAVVLGGGGLLNTGEERYGNFTTTINLFDWAYNNFSWREVISRGDIVSRIPVQYALNNEAAVLRSVQSISLLLPKDLDAGDIAVVPNIRFSSISAPVSSGSVLGTADIVINGDTFATVPLAITADISRDNRAYYSDAVYDFLSIPEAQLCLIVLLFALILILIFYIRYDMIRRRHLRERSEAEMIRQQQKALEDNLRKSREAQEKMQQFRSSAAQSKANTDDDNEDEYINPQGSLPEYIHAYNSDNIR